MGSVQYWKALLGCKGRKLICTPVCVSGTDITDCAGTCKVLPLTYAYGK